jgi:transposase
MPKSYSQDLRARVIETVTSGASRREAAELFDIAASTAVKWMQRLLETGRSAAKPRGGSTSPLEEHATVILGLLRERPDIRHEMFEMVMARVSAIACGHKDAIDLDRLRHDPLNKTRQFPHDGRPASVPRDGGRGHHASQGSLRENERRHD